MPCCLPRRNARRQCTKQSIVDARGHEEARESHRGTHTRGTVLDARGDADARGFQACTFVHRRESLANLKFSKWSMRANRTATFHRHPRARFFLNQIGEVTHRSSNPPGDFCPSSRSSAGRSRRTTSPLLSCAQVTPALIT